MKMVPFITVPPTQYPAITMTNTYANAGDESGKKRGVPKRPVGIGALDLFFFRWLHSQ